MCIRDSSESANSAYSRTSKSGYHHGWQWWERLQLSQRGRRGKGAHRVRLLCCSYERNGKPFWIPTSNGKCLLRNLYLPVVITCSSPLNTSNFTIRISSTIPKQSLYQLYPFEVSELILKNFTKNQPREFSNSPVIFLESFPLRALFPTVSIYILSL